MGTSTPSVLAQSARTRPPTADPTFLGSPLLLVNLKSYSDALGTGAEQIGALLGACGRAAGVAVAIAPATTDLRHLATTLSIPVLAQHVDPMAAGAHTGYTVPAAIRAAGARGSLVNHSEHPLPRAQVDDAVRRLGALGLSAVVCACGVRDAARLARSQPPYLAVEPPELIGSRRSVTTARPKVVSESVDAVRRVAPKTRVLCGAGVHDRRDVARALELGSEGVLVASAVATSATPRATIEELLAGF
ncbi:MAG: triose-phosphate isomerase [Thermoplasmata archaeon]